MKKFSGSMAILSLCEEISLIFWFFLLCFKIHFICLGFYLFNIVYF